MPHERVTSSLEWIDWLVIAVFLLFVAGLGRYFARQQRDTRDFYIGGGKMPWFAVALSVVASLSSTAGYLGDPGEIIQHGIGMLVRLVALPVAIVFTVLWIVPAFRRANVVTAFQLLGQKYGRRTQLLGVSIWSYMQIAFLGFVLLLASRVIAQMIHVPHIWMIFTIGIVSVFFTSAGGMRSVVWTEAFLFSLLLLGALVTLGVVMAKTGSGPTTWWYEVAGRTHSLPPLASWNLTERHTLLGSLMFGLIVTLCYNSSEQVIVQRYFTTRRARTMMIANYVAGTTLSLLTAAVGAALLSFYLVNPSHLPAGVSSVMSSEFADQAFPHFIATELPMGLRGLVIAALLGAAQSTLDSGVNSLAAVFSNDLWPVRRDGDSAATELTRARWSTRLVGGGIIVMAIVADNLPGSNNIIDIAQRFVHLGLGPMGALFMIALSVRNTSSTVAVASLLLGLGSAIFFAFSESLIGRPFISPILIIPGSWLITLLAVALLRVFIKDSQPSDVPTTTA